MSNNKAEVTLDWADGTYTFKLTPPRLIELEQKCGATFTVIFGRLETSTYGIEDVRQIIRLGLIGGGTPAVDAKRLMEAYVDGCPVTENLPLAHAILGGVLFGFRETPLGNREAAPGTTTSTPQPSTEEQQLLA